MSPGTTGPRTFLEFPENILRLHLPEKKIKRRATSRKGRNVGNVKIKIKG